VREPAFDEVPLRDALRLSEDIYRLHEAGQQYVDELRLLAGVTGQDLTKVDVCGAFGSINSDDWARDLLLASAPLPTDLSRDQLVEMIERVIAVADPNWLTHWWLRCVENATGCPDVIEIIYHTDEHFGDDEHDDLTATEILDAALNAPRRVLITPPPDERS
jgi:hypothetical protein